MHNPSVEINGINIPSGQTTTVDVPVARLYTHTPMTMPVHVVNGKKTGPRLFVCAAIHGDEINGVEIIRRLLKLPALKRLQGCLIAVPIVNVFGLVQHSRYLPDRRDLNRSFPGSEKGSLTARLAHLFMTEIVKKCTHGIDLHTGALHRNNLPHLRGNLDHSATRDMAYAFGLPVMLNADLLDGSLRQVAADQGIPFIVYEAGEALRFDEVCIRAGLKGIIEVMRHLEMLPPSKRKHTRKKSFEPVVARSTTWVRAPVSGIFRVTAELGARIHKDSILGVIADPFGEKETQVMASSGGIIIGRLNLPLVNEGDALFHIARFEKADTVAASVEEFHNVYQENT